MNPHESERVDTRENRSLPPGVSASAASDEDGFDDELDHCDDCGEAAVTYPNGPDLVCGCCLKVRETT